MIDEQRIGSCDDFAHDISKKELCMTGFNLTGEPVRCLPCMALFGKIAPKNKHFVKEFT